jgi:hypothetical protein
MFRGISLLPVVVTLTLGKPRPRRRLCCMMASSANTGRSGRRLRAVAAEEGDLAGEDKQQSAEGLEGGSNELYRATV